MYLDFPCAISFKFGPMCQIFAKMANSEKSHFLQLQIGFRFLVLFLGSIKLRLGLTQADFQRVILKIMISKLKSLFLHILLCKRRKSIQMLFNRLDKWCKTYFIVSDDVHFIVSCLTFEIFLSARFVLHALSLRTAVIFITT